MISKEEAREGLVVVLTEDYREKKFIPVDEHLKSLSSRPVSKFKVGDIVDTNDKGWQFTWESVDNPNALSYLSSKQNIKKGSKVTHIIWSDKHNMWWYRVDSYGNAYTESALEPHVPEKKKNTYKSLIEEAKERGVWEVPIVDAHGDKEELSVYGANQPCDTETDTLWSSYGKVYYKGQWATPLKEEVPSGTDISTISSLEQRHYDFEEDFVMGIDYYTTTEVLTLSELKEKYPFLYKEDDPLQHQTPVTFPKKKKGKRLQITDF